LSVTSLEQRIERVEVHVDAHHQLLADLRSGLRQFEALPFCWLVGIILTGIVTIAAAVLAG